MYLIFSDVDGTVYNHETKEIHPQLIKDINFARSRGVEFIICTGNAYFDNMTKLAIHLDVRYVVTSNGASIFDRVDNKFVFLNKLKQDKAQILWDKANEFKIGANWWDENIMKHNSHISEELLLNIARAMTEEKNYVLGDKVDHDVLKIEFDGTKEQLNEMESLCDSLNLEYARMGDNWLEVTGNNVSKGKAMHWLSEKLGGTLETTMAIGDSGNDLSMLKLAKYSYAMANGSDIVKETAKFHTSRAEQNGLGEAIIDFLHREKLDRQ